jgi:hypothetical protein
MTMTMKILLEQKRWNNKDDYKTIFIEKRKIKIKINIKYLYGADAGKEK